MISLYLTSLVLAIFRPVITIQAWVSLVEYNISNIAYEVIDSQAPEEDMEEVKWQWT